MIDRDKHIKTNIDNLEIRFAKEEDTKLILKFIKDLAEYERLSQEVVATEETLYESLFVKRQAEVIIAEYNHQPVGFALFFHNFSTFLGKANLYLEDLYVKPSARNLGIGKALLSTLAQIAIERDCKRLDWWCLDWNKSSIEFYKKMGAVPMDEWTVYRVENEALANLADLIKPPRK